MNLEDDYTPAEALRAYVHSLVESEAGIPPPAEIGRRVVADAYGLKLLREYSQHELGVALGYSPKSAKQGFNALLARRAKVTTPKRELHDIDPDSE